MHLDGHLYFKSCYTCDLKEIELPFPFSLSLSFFPSYFFLLLLFPSLQTFYFYCLLTSDVSKNTIAVACTFSIHFIVHLYYFYSVNGLSLSRRSSGIGALNKTNHLGHTRNNGCARRVNLDTSKNKKKIRQHETFRQFTLLFFMLILESDTARAVK